ncbi:hypothetical protein BDP81DRAFT_459318 [Colletotrichum phormii]|uniref:FAD-binding domain-containing protein n=1 Tax=Colletotrichum phormii TaxID=359342 RepID=A0AAI9ZXF4_9PEZI|nr:uncharacterized protein BDP81DRAFT_459318 [Colletotrichum phormii]KAK1638624.1 hypothetical protein BDP81DRAFT_459318 [Colletotrichum phormii]
MATMRSICPWFPLVIVIGTGPTGLLLSLLLAKHSIPVLTLDKSTSLCPLPRATHYGPPPTTRLGTDNPDRISCLPLNQLCKLALEDLEREPGAEVRWGREAVVKMRTEDGVEEFIIRRELFGDEFPGYTWDLQIIATNVNSNFVIYPTDYFMAAKIQDDGLWRVSYGEVPGLSHDEYRRRQPAKYETMLPGNPKPDDYRIVNLSPYKVHQRLAPRMRVGRFILAGDAAHLCNPFGGMGLTGGLVDVGDLFDCLAGIHDGRADDDILDKYDHYRREKYNQFTNPISEANLKRMASDPDEVEANDPGIVAMREADKTDEAAVAFQLGVLGLAHDMTQYYKK